MSFEAIQALRKQLLQRLKDQIVQEVPEADALCEFDCRKQQCKEGEWATCERRLHKAAGELWPGPKTEAIADTGPNAQPSQVDAAKEAAD